MSRAGDSALGGRVRSEITQRIAVETEQLINTPTDKRAGYIQGLQFALSLLDAPEPTIPTQRPRFET